MAHTVSGLRLPPADQRHVLNAFIYRMTEESVKRWPEAARQMWAGGYRLPIISDQAWLACTLFWVKNDGRLDRRCRYCQSDRPRGDMVPA